MKDLVKRLRKCWFPKVGTPSIAIEAADRIEGLQTRIEELGADNAWRADRAKKMQARIEELEDKLFTLGLMEKAPCFCCGYNGPNYYHPEQHPCAERHHRLRRRDD